MSEAHFTPWQAAFKPCWFCVSFDGITASGADAWCRLPGVARVRSSPAAGCSSFVREIGADDDPDALPQGYRCTADVAARAGNAPRLPAAVAWAP